MIRLCELSQTASIRTQAATADKITSGESTVLAFAASPLPYEESIRWLLPAPLGDCMRIMREIGEFLSPNDPELVEKTLTRIAEQDTWNDVFSTKLIELLDNIDLLKTEHRQKLRAVETATQNASVSLEKAENAHNRAAENFREAKRTLNESARQLDRARDCTTESEGQLRAAEDRLRSSEQILEKACELERLSEQKYVNAVKLVHKVVQYSVYSVAISLVAIVWYAWMALRTGFPIWAPSLATVVILLAATFIPKSLEI